jgi:hypothetical protein
MSVSILGNGLVFDALSENATYSLSVPIWRINLMGETDRQILDGI